MLIEGYSLQTIRLQIDSSLAHGSKARKGFDRRVVVLPYAASGYPSSTALGPDSRGLELERLSPSCRWSAGEARPVPLDSHRSRKLPESRARRPQRDDHRARRRKSVRPFSPNERELELWFTCAIQSKFRLQRVQEGHVDRAIRRKRVHTVPDRQRDGRIGSNVQSSVAVRRSSVIETTVHDEFASRSAACDENDGDPAHATTMRAACCVIRNHHGQSRWDPSPVRFMVRRQARSSGAVSLYCHVPRAVIQAPLFSVQTVADSNSNLIRQRFDGIRGTRVQIHSTLIGLASCHTPGVDARSGTTIVRGVGTPSEISGLTKESSNSGSPARLRRSSVWR